ncbi:MAG TPA: hypothetical protein VGE07_12785, partial [Herpetosiphonaceae bacterium]
LLALLSLYALLVAMAVALAPAVASPAARFSILLLPIIPALLGAWSALRMPAGTSRQDQIARSALVVATAGMGLGALAVAGRDLGSGLSLAVLWLLPLGAAAWGMVVAVASKRAA